jgi:protein SCO1/2/putative membrane protein
VFASYRNGGSLVLATVVLALAVCLATVRARPVPATAGHDLGEHAYRLGGFRLEERSGRVVSDADLAGRVWIASFIFTRCPASCPRISSAMKGLQGKLARSRVQLVSVSVDPEHDTPAVLGDYATRFGADPARWWFLTGPKDDVYGLILKGFHLGVADSSDEDQKAGAEAVSHSAKLALVAPGNTVVGYYNAEDPDDLKALADRASRLSAAAAPAALPPWVRGLPTVNAALNSLCAILLVTGWTLIRSGQARAHAACMILGVVVSALFLTCYLVYHFYAGSVPYRGAGPLRLVYFTVLLSHTVLAAAVVPLIATTLVRAARRDFVRHARVARFTFPVWLYVSVTGVVIYVMLYQLPVTG